MMDNRAPIEAVLKKRDRSTGYRWTKEILGLLDEAGVFQAAVTSGAPAPHAKGRDVEAALEAIQEATGTLALQAALPVGDTGQIMDFASRSLSKALATLRAALAELEDGHLTIARAIGMVDEDQGRIASVATAEAIAGAIGELRRTDDAKTDEWMCAGREAALAEKADNMRHPTGQFVGVQPSPAGQHWYDKGFDAGREAALAEKADLIALVERVGDEPVYWRCPECGDAPDISGRWRWCDSVPEHHHGYPVGHIKAERVQDDPPADPDRVTVDRELLGSVLCLLGSLSSVAAVEAADAICTILAGPERQPEGGAS